MIKDEEFQRYGKEMLIGGNKHDQSNTFLEWASLYDSTGLEFRSRTLHEHWMVDLNCPVLKIVGDCSQGTSRYDLRLSEF